MKTSCSMTSVVKHFSFSWFVMPLLCATALFFAGCEKKPPTDKAAIVKFTGKTMGTYWQATVAAHMNSEEKEQLQQAIEKRLVEVNQEMSTYIPDSELSLFNKNLTTDPVKISSALQKVIAKGLQISGQSDGVYDVTVAPLVEIWGFGPKKITEKPSAEALQQALSKVGYQKLTLTETTLQKSNPETEIDLSSIAKGYGVDEVGEVIKKAGFNNYLVDIGGEVVVNGDKRGKAWTVAIETPEVNTTGGSIQTVISLNNDLKAVATSGNYRNYIDFDGIRAVHTINPKTGQTTQSGLLSASVFSRDCMSADGYATTLMALGDTRAYDFAEKENLAAIFIYAGNQPHTFTVKYSTAFMKAFGEQL